MDINYVGLLEDRLYKHDYTPPPETIALTVDNKTIGTLGNFVVVSGLPKAGKSTYINSIIASNYIYGRSKFGITLTPEYSRPLIGYFDTESAPFDFYRNVSRIRSLAGGAPLETLASFSTRQDNTEINKGLIEAFCANYRASVVIIDGLLDIIINFNDERESRYIIEWLKRITYQYNVLIIGVLHTGKKDGHTLGHFGSMVDRYAQSVLEVTFEEETNIYRMKAKYLRSAARFEDITIQFTGSDYIQAFGVPSPKKKSPA